MSRFKKKKRYEDHDNNDRWLISYADFITLMFAFFVVMYATATKNEEKEKSFENSVKASLKIAVVGMGGSGGPSKGSESGGNAVFDKWIPELVRGHSEDSDEFPQKGSNAEIQDFIKRQLDKKIPADKRKEEIGSYNHDSKGVRVTLAASSFFPVGSYKLKRSSLQTLNELGEILKQTNRHIIIEGHTDNTPIGSASEQSSDTDSETAIPISSNWELASLRATSVVRYLIQMHGLSADRLAAISYADQKPVDTN